MTSQRVTLWRLGCTCPVALTFAFIGLECSWKLKNYGIYLFTSVKQFEGNGKVDGTLFVKAV